MESKPINFVTGATGLVGAHLCLFLLQQQESVVALYRSENSIQKTKQLFDLYQQASLFTQIKWVPGDILDIPSLEKHLQPNMLVYHCAAKISFDPSDRESLLKTNIEGTANMVHVCTHKKIKKFCHVSSIAALGDWVAPMPWIDEETPWLSEKPHSDYALSKYGAELEVFKASYEGLPMVVVNPGVILGPGFWNEGSGVIFSKVAKGLPFYTKGSTGFIAVSDLVKIMHQLMHANLVQDRFICIAENVTYKNLIKNICKALQKPDPKIWVKPWMTSIAWRLDAFVCTLFRLKRNLDRATAKSMHTKEVISNQKIKDAIGFTFTPIETYIPTLAEFWNQREK